MNLSVGSSLLSKAVALSLLLVLSGCLGFLKPKPTPQELLDAGDAAGAVEALKIELAEEPENLEKLKVLAHAQEIQGDFGAAAATMKKVTRLDSRDAASLAKLGDLLVKSDGQHEAAAAFHSALSLEPENESYHQRLRETLEGLGMFDQYVAAVRELLATQPEDAGQLTALGQEYSGAGHAQAAVDAYRASLKLDPSQAEVWTLLARELTGMGEVDEALEALEEAAMEVPDNLAHLRLTGQLRYRSGRFPQAGEAFEAALKLDPADPESLAGLALSRHALGKAREAHKMLQKELRKNKESEVLWLAAARVALGRRQWPTVRRSIDAALKLNPDSAEAHQLEGVLFSKQGRLEKAEAALLKARELDPINAETRVRLAQLYLATDRISEATTEVAKALELDRRFMEAVELKGELDERAGEYNKALGSYERLSRQQRKESRWKYKRGEMHLLLGEKSEAGALAEQLVEDWPKEGLGYLLQARLLMLDGDLSGAQKSLARAKRLMSRSSEIEVARGDLQRLQGRIRNAMVSYRRAIRYDKANRDAHLALAELMLESDKKRAAKGQLELVIKIGPESVQAARAKELLESDALK